MPDWLRAHIQSPYPVWFDVFEVYEDIEHRHTYSGTHADKWNVERFTSSITTTETITKKKKIVYIAVDGVYES